MLDAAARARVAPGLDAAAAWLHRRGVSAAAVTWLGLLAGIGACAAAATSTWAVALALWLLNRTLDGLDGAIARREGPTDLGGMLDLLADFVVYGGFLLAVAVAIPGARIACSAALVAVLLNNVALLSFASLVEKRGLAFGDERSLRFTSALVEGTETIVVYALICALPGQAELIVWGFAAAVAVGVLQRIALARAALGSQTPARASRTAGH